VQQGSGAPADTDSIHELVARVVESRRQELGLSRHAVEKTAGIASGVVGRIEKRKSLPSLVTLTHLCVALDLIVTITAAGMEITIGRG
jgi:transcriptional regulator with XRE-family HTH domain